jgi:hypothetical protein
VTASEKATASTPACHECGRPILWLRNVHTGTLAPVDAEPASGGTIVRVRTVEYRVLGNQESTNQPTHYSHFVTCPQGESWRQPRRKDTYRAPRRK